MHAKQMDLFDLPKTELCLLWEALTESKTSTDKMRRRLFAEVTDLQQQVIEIRSQNERLLAMISHNVG